MAQLALAPHSKAPGGWKCVTGGSRGRQPNLLLLELVALRHARPREEMRRPRS